MKQCLEEKRKNMVEGQILPQQVTNVALLEALKNIPREDFLPPHLANLAYSDAAISLGHGRYMMAPMVLARLLQAADIQPTDSILDIGCGTGYSSAILGCIAESVIGLEQDKTMAMGGVHQLDHLDLKNAMIIHQGDWHHGYPKKAPYDVILINGAVSVVPEKIQSQLADGGRLVTVISRNGRIGTATLITRTGSQFTPRSLFDTATPVLAGFENKKGFTFQ